MVTVVTDNKLKETLPGSFFERHTVQVARELIGMLLCRRMDDGTILSGTIVEAEAYTHDDPACHAYRGKTARCEVMFGPGGYAYVYFIYGMYFCLNVVTEVDGVAGAVLIRATDFEGTNGPGKLCRQWAIDRSHNGINLMDWQSPIWLARGTAIPDLEVETTKRIGLSVAQDQLWRFTAKGHPAVSGARTKNSSKTASSSTTSSSTGVSKTTTSKTGSVKATSKTVSSKPTSSKTRSSKTASSKAVNSKMTTLKTASSKSTSSETTKTTRSKAKITP